MTVGDCFLWPLETLPEWSARWITAPGVANQTNCLFRARKAFSVDTAPATLNLHIAAESIYRLYVNGIDLGRGPARGTRTVNFYDSYEIAPLTTIGTNWIAIEVQSPNRLTFKAAPSLPAVLVQCEGADIHTDSSWEVQAAPDWLCDVPAYTVQIGYTEWRNFALDPLGWKIGSDDLTWSRAIELATNEILAAKALLPRDIPPLRETVYGPVDVPVIAAVPDSAHIDQRRVAQIMDDEPHSPFNSHIALPILAARGGPIVIEPLAGGAGVCVILDFRREINGRLEIDLDAPGGTIADIGYEEEMQNGRLPLVHDDRSFADRYQLRSGRQIVGDSFTERGYRLAQVVLRNFKSPIKIHGVSAIDRRYPYVDRGSFTCSDALVNSIWDACAETLRACTTDTLVDCPWRENVLYYNDMLVESVTSLQAFGDPRIIARCFRLAVSQTRPNGLIPAAVPMGSLDGLTTDQAADRLVLPASNLCLPAMLEEYLLYTGDQQLVSELLDDMMQVLDTISGWEDADGLIVPPKQYWNFIDWSFPKSLDGINTATLNWFYVQSLDSAVRLLRRIGDTRDTSALETKAAKVAAATDARFWSKARNCYVEYSESEEFEPLASQICHAVALLSGRLPAERIDAARAALNRDDLLAPDLYLQHLRLRALAASGNAAGSLEQIRRYWGPIVLSGSPTIWECGVHTPGKHAFGNAGSLCHGFSTSPVDFLQTVVLGVRPLNPGFARCQIAPQALGLNHAHGIIPTPHGNLSVDWARAGDTLALSLRVPSGVTAVLPDGSEINAGNHQIEVRIDA